MTDLTPEVVRIPLALEPDLRFHHVYAEALAAEIAVMLDRLVSD